MSDSQTIQALLNEVATGSFVDIPPAPYIIDTPLIIDFGTQVEGGGFSGKGVTLISTITNGAPLLTIKVAANRYIRGFDFYKLRMQGSGTDGHGLFLDLSGGSAIRGDFYNFSFQDWMIEGFGGDGVNAQGSIFEGFFKNVRSRGNKGNGATLGSNGGVMSTMAWEHGSLGQNGKSGASLVGEAYDVKFSETYFLENGGPGIACPNGVSLVKGGGFENNQQSLAAGSVGPAVQGQNFGTFIGTTCGQENGKQTTMLNGFYLVSKLTLVGCQGVSGTVNGAGVVNQIGCGGSLIAGNGNVHIENL